MYLESRRAPRLADYPVASVLPRSGRLLRTRSAGWSDQHVACPLLSGVVNLTDMPRVPSWGAIRRTSSVNIRGEWGQPDNALTVGGTSTESSSSISVADLLQFFSPCMLAHSSRTAANTDSFLRSSRNGIVCSALLFTVPCRSTTTVAGAREPAFSRNLEILARPH
jgi:hypothetical protein